MDFVLPHVAPANTPTMQQTSRRLWRNTLLALIALAALTIIAKFWLRPDAPALQAQISPPMQDEASGVLNAPEFPEGRWLNTEKPLSLRALRGKIVLLDFWTYGCINCMHILPDLKKLEAKYPNELVIISVHSAKFENEQDAANIRNAMLRYNIEHPVYVDSGMKVWDAYTVRAWPTLVLIDPTGKIHGSVSGEGHYDLLDANIAEMVQRFGGTGQLNRTPLKFALDAAKRTPTPLWYPGKVLADEATRRIFVADSNHNRIVISDWDGNVQTVVGNGDRALRDGAFHEAAFSNPQGLALQKNEDGNSILLVADTNNHALRALDLKRGTVKTIAGTGEQAAWRAAGGVGAEAALSSPWDLQLVGDTLYIAMAGPHQIWAMDLNSRRVAPFAGSGREARLDGTLQSAAFAQPSGLSTDGQVLFVADSEISAIRAVELPSHGDKVRTLAGGNLFDFGDVDGVGDAVRLQHPLGVAFHEGMLYLADTYNDKIKILDPRTGRVHTFLGDKRGDADGAQPQFYEPGGLDIAGDKLFVADTNNHKIKIIDLKTKNTTTLTLKNLSAPHAADGAKQNQANNQTAQNSNAQEEAGTITLPVTQLAPNAQGELILDVQLPAAHHLNLESPQQFQARVEGRGVQLSRAAVRDKDFRLPLKVKIKTGAAGSEGAVIVSTTVFYCSDANGLCKFKSWRFRAPFTVRAAGARQLILRAAV